MTERPALESFPAGMRVVVVLGAGKPTAAPLQPAVWLFGSALGVMGVLRRKIRS